MKLFKNIWLVISGILSMSTDPKVGMMQEAFPQLNLSKTDEDKMLEMAERLEVLTVLIRAFQTDGIVSFTMATTEHIANLEEAAKLRFQLQVLFAKRKEKTLVERLTTENAHLLNDLRAANSKYQRDVYGLNNEGDPIGGDAEPGGFANEAARYKKLWISSRLNEVTDYRDFKELEHYWLLSRDFNSLHVSQCKEKTISSHWITEDNHLHTMQKYRFFGPIPHPEIPSDIYDQGATVLNANEA